MHRIIEWLKRVRRNGIDYLERLYVSSEFRKEFGNGIVIERNLLLLAHALEKGMGLPLPRSKFGVDKAVKLLELLEQYVSEGCDTNRYAFSEGVSVLKAYVDFIDNDFSAYRERIERLNYQLTKHNLAGVEKVIDISEIYAPIDFEQVEYFIKSRHSIRSFVQRPIGDDLVHRAVKLAIHAPSACNRQPVKIYWTSDKNTVAKISNLIPGNKGFEEEVPNWAFVTSDRNMFVTSETLQWNVNGGIFLAYFIEALHALEIGSCIFQIPIKHPNIPELRRIAGISDNEAIIAAVGFGWPKVENKFVVAARRFVDELLVKI